MSDSQKLDEVRTPVSLQEIRGYFNENIQPRIDDSTYTVRIKRRTNAHPDSNQPDGTKSCSFRVYDENMQRIAAGHVFELPDGTWGASGKLDPTYIKVGPNEAIFNPDH